jgi:hypothetical protein
MDTWISKACAELGIDEPARPERTAVVELARTVNHVAAQPVASITMYLFGLAVGRGMPASEAANRVTALAKRWQQADCDWRD